MAFWQEVMSHDDCVAFHLKAQVFFRWVPFLFFLSILKTPVGIFSDHIQFVFCSYTYLSIYPLVLSNNFDHLTTCNNVFKFISCYQASVEKGTKFLQMKCQHVHVLLTIKVTELKTNWNKVGYICVLYTQFDHSALEIGFI